MTPSSEHSTFEESHERIKLTVQVGPPGIGLALSCEAKGLIGTIVSLFRRRAKTDLINPFSPTSAAEFADRLRDSGFGSRAYSVPRNADPQHRHAAKQYELLLRLLCQSMSDELDALRRLLAEGKIDYQVTNPTFYRFWYGDVLQHLARPAFLDAIHAGRVRDWREAAWLRDSLNEQETTIKKNHARIRRVLVLDREDLAYDRIHQVIAEQANRGIELGVTAYHRMPEDNIAKNLNVSLIWQAGDFGEPREPLLCFAYLDAPKDPKLEDLAVRISSHPQHISHAQTQLRLFWSRRDDQTPPEIKVMKIEKGPNLEEEVKRALDTLRLPPGKGALP